jgi:hypothetical protein
MDVSSEYMVTGHDKNLTLWNVESSYKDQITKVWEVNTSDEVQIKTQIEKKMNLVLASSSAKNVTLFDLKSG